MPETLPTNTHVAILLIASTVVVIVVTLVDKVIVAPPLLACLPVVRVAVGCVGVVPPQYAGVEQMVVHQPLPMHADNDDRQSI